MLGLKGRYTVAMVALIAFIVCLLSSVFLSMFKVSLYEHTRVSSEAMTEDLLIQMKKRGEAITRLLARNLMTPIYYDDMQAIYELLDATREMKDVLYTCVYDSQGRILHDGDETIPTFGMILDDKKSLAALQTKGRLEMEFAEGVLGVSLPIWLGDRCMGGVKVRLSLNDVNRDIARMQQYHRTISQKVLQNAVTALIVLMVGLIFMGVIISLFVAGRLIRPIEALSGYAQQVGRGDYDSTISYSRRDEIGDLIHSFYRMSQDLKAKDEDLRSAHEQLERRVRERTSELLEANRLLQEEIKQRIHAEQELKRTQAQLIQSGKLASIGELAAGVAHELNQPLMVIRLTAQVLVRSISKKTPTPEALVEQLETIERNTKRMMNIINHLRTFSRDSEGEFSLVDVNQVVKDCLLMVGEQMRLRNIEVKLQLVAGLPMIPADSNQLEQVFLNLITNGRDAIMEKAGNELKQGGAKVYRGALDILTRCSGRGGACGLHDSVGEQNCVTAEYVEVLFRDNGNGISPGSMDKLYDPFFTTKEVGKGTGLGLAITYGIIKDHGGEIAVADTGPEGTTFRVKLPV